MAEFPLLKGDIRRRTLAARKLQPPEERESKSREICRQIAQIEEYQNAQTILFYMPIRGEANITPLLQARLREGRKCLLPKCGDERLLELFYINDLDLDLTIGKFNILEPCGRAIPCTAEGISVIIVPGVAFDAYGRRIGYGKGYYDRLLSSLRGKTALIAPAFELQLVDSIPADACDMPVDYIVTERRFIDCRKARG